jgi:TRAP-type transport system periplasmic protein
MSRRSQRQGFSILLLIAFLSLVGVHSAIAEKWQLSILWPASNFSTQGVMKFADLVKERTEGRVAIEVHPGGALGFKGPDMLQAMKDGLVPVGEMLLGYVAGTEPIMDLSTMPFLVADYGEAHLLGVVSRPYVQKVFNKWNQKLLYWQYWPGAGIYAKKPINSLEDLKGLKIRTFNNISTQWVMNAGGKPVSMPWGDVYMAMSSGAIDALLTSSVSGADGKFWEVMSHFTSLGFTFGYSAVTVNLTAWNKLSDKDKAIIIDAAHEMDEFQEKQSILSDKTSMAKLVANGMKVTEISPEFQKQCADLAKPIWTEWAGKVGPDGKLMIDEFNTLTGK